MPVYLLSDAEYEATLVGPMRRLDEEAEAIAVDLSAYVRECLETWDRSAALEDIDIPSVYLSAAGRFTHVLLDCGQVNAYLVVVVDNAGKAIRGHYRLDLNAQYGLAPGKERSSFFPPPQKQLRRLL